MAWDLTAEDQAFRQEVRAFLREHLPAPLAKKVREQFHLSKEDFVSWHRILHQRGWSAPAWPREYGGAGWAPMRCHIFEDECAAADAPPLVPFGLSMVGPVIYTYGTPQQKAHYLPRILTMEDYWCQGYSEPGAGSDLAALRTRAERDGDYYVINGSKIWTSEAHYANMMFCLVRTDPQAKAQRGISFLLIDMATPGITVRPIISIDGGHELNETFLENVRVPVANRIGEENAGWDYAKFLLGHERSAIADVGRTKRRLQRLKEIAGAEQLDGAPLLDCPVFSNRVAAVEIDLLALECTNLRLLLGDSTSGSAPIAVSMMKLRGSEVLQAVSELACDALGYTAMSYEPRAGDSHQPVDAPDYALGRVEDYLFRRAASIYGGSSETQRNILAKLIFGF